MSLMARVKRFIREWIQLYSPGVVIPPKEPKDQLTLEEALELFQGENEAEWEEDE